jgi:hypothetical protein
MHLGCFVGDKKQFSPSVRKEPQGNLFFDRCSRPHLKRPRHFKMDVQWCLRKQVSGLIFAAGRVLAHYYCGRVTSVVFEGEINGWRAIRYMHNDDDAYRPCNILMPPDYFTREHQATLISPRVLNTTCRDK